MNLSSAGHRFSDVDLDDPNFEHTPYTEFGAYGRSKTANILFAVEFDRRHKARGVRATAVHPGGIQTELGRHMTPEAMQALIDNRSTPPARSGRAGLRVKTIPQGAATSVWAGVVAPGRRGGRPLLRGLPRRRAHRSGTDIRGGVRAYALDPDHAKALWAKSEEMVGETVLTASGLAGSPGVCDGRSALGSSADNRSQPR